MSSRSALKAPSRWPIAPPTTSPSSPWISKETSFKGPRRSHVGKSPKAIAFGHFRRLILPGSLNSSAPAGPTVGSLFVATRSAPGQEDVILAYEVLRDADGHMEFVPAGSTPAGALVTDIEVTRPNLFAVSVNPATGRDQLLSFRRDGTQLTFEDKLETAGPPPSFKNLSSAPVPGPIDRVLFVTEFQGGWLRSVLYDRAPH